jgi:hypothetical protein
MFYPVMLTTFMDLMDGLIQDGYNDKALKVLHKYDEVMPDLNPYIDVAGRKFYMAQIAYKLNDIGLGNKFVNSIDSYLTDQLNYNYYQLQQKDGSSIDGRVVQLGIQLLNGMSEITAQNHQDALSKKLKAQLTDYSTKFAPFLGRQ